MKLSDLKRHSGENFEKIQNRLAQFQEEDFEQIKRFCHKLLVENDIEYCEANYDEFLCYFEKREEQLKPIDDIIAKSWEKIWNG